MKRHQVWCGFVVLFVLLASTQTQAKIQPNLNISQNQGSKGIVFVNRDQLLQIANSPGVKVQMFKISKHYLAKLAASGPKGCGCALEDEFASGGGCFSNCLKDWGISATTVAACAGACISAGSGNPVGLWLCAVCTGAGDAIVLGCSISCMRFSTKNVAPKVPLPPNFRHGRTRGGDSAKVRLNTVRSASLR